MVGHDVTIFCVLRSSPAYDTEYVRKLKEQCAVYAPKVRFACISNVAVPCERVPMKKMWPGWWSKIELFRPDITGDMLFIDLDTIIVDEIQDILNVRELTMLTDFFRPAVYGSGLMYIPESARNDVWKTFIKNSIGFIQRYKRGGDQEFLMSVWGNKPARWQEVLPNRVISYKAQRVPSRGIPEGTGIVCHHGRPKPRDIKWRYPNMRYDNGRWVRENDNLYRGHRTRR